MEAKPTLKESLAQIAANRENLEQLKKVVDVPKPGNTEADIETLLNLMGSEDKPRAAWLNMLAVPGQHDLSTLLIDDHGRLY